MQEIGEWVVVGGGEGVGDSDGVVVCGVEVTEGVGCWGVQDVGVDVVLEDLVELSIQCSEGERCLGVAYVSAHETENCVFEERPRIR